MEYQIIDPATNGIGQGRFAELGHGAGVAEGLFPRAKARAKGSGHTLYPSVNLSAKEADDTSVYGVGNEPAGRGSASPKLNGGGYGTNQVSVNWWEFQRDEPQFCDDYGH